MAHFQDGAVVDPRRLLLAYCQLLLHGKRRAGRIARLKRGESTMGHALSRRSFIATAVAAAGCSLVSANAATTPPPNIVYIMADDLGWGDLGCYGQTHFATPHIDRLAAEGIRFTQCYSGSSVCAPSRCCLMTGMHNGHGRVRDNLPHGVFLQPDDKTVAEVLKQAGYTTGAIGKWSLGNPGSWGVANFQGFDYFYGHLDQDQAHFYYPDHLWENDKVVLLTGNRADQHGEYTHDLFTQKALNFIEENKQDPFFLYLPYTIPHWSDFPKDDPDSQIVPDTESYKDKGWPPVERNFAAMVKRLDDSVGAIMEKIKALGLDSNTIVFFTSDNGASAEGSHDPAFFNSTGGLRGAKRQQYEGGIRIPMIARWPGHVPVGETSDQIWAFWDFLPTAAELAGLPAVTDTDGISMVPAIMGKKQKQQHEYLYWDYAHVRGTFSQAVRAGDWKALRNGPGADVELYNLADDVGETTDIASKHPDVVKRMTGYMDEAFVPSPDYPIAPPEAATTS